MSADSTIVAAPRSGSRRVRTTLAWVAYLALLVSVARLYRIRVTSSSPTDVNTSAAQAKPIATDTAPSPAESSAQAPLWLAKLDTISKSDVAPTEICRRLRAAWPSLPEDGQLEALRRIVNLLPDGDYVMIRDFAATTPLPPSAWEILATDALTRPSAVNMPVLLEVLAHGDEPARSEASAELVAQLGADYGEDWARWKEEIQHKLAKPE